MTNDFDAGEMFARILIDNLEKSIYSDSRNCRENRYIYKPLDSNYCQGDNVLQNKGLNDTGNNNLTKKSKNFLYRAEELLREYDRTHLDFSKGLNTREANYDE